MYRPLSEAAVGQCNRFLVVEWKFWMIIRIKCARQFLISVRSRLGRCGQDGSKYLVYAANQTLIVRPVGYSLSCRSTFWPQRTFDTVAVSLSWAIFGPVCALCSRFDRSVDKDGKSKTAALHSMQGQSKVKQNPEIKHPSRTPSMYSKCQLTVKLCATQSKTVMDRKAYDMWGLIH